MPKYKPILLAVLAIALLPYVVAGVTTVNIFQASDATYGVGWDGSLEAPTQNAVYDELEAIQAGGGDLDALANDQWVGWTTSASGGLRTSTTSGETWKLQLRDTDDNVWRDAITGTAGATPTMTMTPTSINLNSLVTLGGTLHTLDISSNAAAGATIYRTGYGTGTFARTELKYIGNDFLIGVTSGGGGTGGGLIMASNTGVITLAHDGVANRWQMNSSGHLIAQSDYYIDADRHIVNDTNGATLAAADARGQIYTNTGASGGQTFNLPAAVAGMHVTVILSASDDVNINPDNADQILVLTNAVGDAISSDATAGSRIALVAIDATNWVVEDSAGTWSDVN